MKRENLLVVIKEGVSSMDLWKNIIVKPDALEHVTKYVFEGESAVAEAVLYRYPDYKTRTVICCSTEAGCRCGCRFCGAGDYFVRSLTGSEIVSQVDRCLEDIDCNVSEIGRLQIMFMSMGEPLLNLKNLIPAMSVLNNKYPKARLLISTIGPAIPDRKWRELLFFSQCVETVGLQFSVHESSDEKRDKLIPFKKKLTLKEISEHGHEFFRMTGRKPYFNYCAHDKNTSNEDADILLDLFPPDVFCATVSVICERNEGMSAKNEYQRKLALDFGDKLLNRGFDVRVFDPAGQDTIGGGCGQLWFVQNWMKNNPDLAHASVGSGKDTVHVPKV